MKTFSIIGAGYILPKHLKAIKENNCELKAVFDISDSVGILDSYFPHTKFFTDYFEFKKYSRNIDYLVILLPNYLHYNAVKEGLSFSRNIIVEKPAVIYEEEYLELMNYDNVFQIFQYRANPKIIQLKKSIDKNKFYNGSFIVNTFRGDWYKKSWKFDIEKSGGLKFNIGSHVFDLFVFLFGKIKFISDYYESDTKIKAKLEFDNAEFFVNLSIDNPGCERKFIINNEEIDLVSNFGNLHSEVYKRILNNGWFTLKETFQSFDLINKLGK